MKAHLCSFESARQNKPRVNEHRITFDALFDKLCERDESFAMGNGFDLALHRESMTDEEFGVALLEAASDFMTDQEKATFKVKSTSVSDVSYNNCHCGGRFVKINTGFVCDWCGCMFDVQHTISHVQSRRRVPRDQRLKAHFLRALALCEGTLHVNPMILEKTKCELARRRQQVTYETVKDALAGGRIAPRRIAPCVASALGCSMPKLTSSERASVVSLFSDFRVTIEEVAFSYRKKQLAYTYIASQLLRQAGIKTRLNIHNIETPQNLIESNITWREVCRKLGWKFVPI